MPMTNSGAQGAMSGYGIMGGQGMMPGQGMTGGGMSMAPYGYSAMGLPGSMQSGMMGQGMMGGGGVMPGMGVMGSGNMGMGGMGGMGMVTPSGAGSFYMGEGREAQAGPVCLCIGGRRHRADKYGKRACTRTPMVARRVWHMAIRQLIRWVMRFTLVGKEGPGMVTVNLGIRQGSRI